MMPLLRTAALTVLATAVGAAALAQAPMAPMAPMTDHGTSVGGKPLASPAAVATTEIAGKTITIKYNAPSMRGRKIFGGLVPYGKEWRTGANPATTLITPIDLTIGDLKVPAGTYTLFTLPSEGTWKLILSSKTGEWGVPYPAGSDFGRTPMMKTMHTHPQEVMSIAFEHTTADKTQLHVLWDTTDVYVGVAAQ